MSAGGARRRPPLGAWALGALLLWLVGYPLAITLLEALGFPTQATLVYLDEFRRRPDEWLALWRSLWISAASVGLAAAVGVPLAFVFERLDFPGRRVLGSLVALPVALPPLVGLIAFIVLYDEEGFVTRVVQLALGLEDAPWRLAGPGAILLVHAYSMYVYFYLFCRAGLARLDASVEEAAAILGAGRARTLFRVVLPLLRPALAGAALLTFMTSLASFSAPYYFGGGGFRVMTAQIAASKLNMDLEMAKTETVVLALVALAGLAVMMRFDRGQTAVVGGVRGVAPRRRALRGPLARTAAAILGWGLTLILLLPHLALAVVSLVPPSTWTTELVPPVLNLDNYRQLLSPELFRQVTSEQGLWSAINTVLLSPEEQLRPVVNSLWMATVATVAAVALGVAVARTAGRAGGRTGRVLETLIAVPWAVPGTVFAIALATTFAVRAPALGRFVLVGTPWILTLAYLVRSLPLTGRAAFAGMRQLDPSLEEAAASLGAGRWRTLWRVSLPMLRPAIVAGASLAFITALGDFVTSFLLYTYDTRPISMAIWSRLRLETGVAAVYGVLLMIVSAAAFLVWGREERR